LLFYRLLHLVFYGLHWIDIFLSFPKIPSLLKSVFRCKSYRIFREDILCRFRARFKPEIEPEFQPEIGPKISYFNRKLDREFLVPPGILVSLQTASFL
jgi:hypothetical protein